MNLFELFRSHLIADELSARLIHAVKRDDLEELQMLLELGADPDCRSVEIDEVGYPEVSLHGCAQAHYVGPIGFCCSISSERSR